MDFFDPKRWRITSTNASKHFRSLFEEQSRAVASSARAETRAAHALALLSSRVQKPVKGKMSSMPAFLDSYSDQRAMHRLRLLAQRSSCCSSYSDNAAQQFVSFVCIACTAHFSAVGPTSTRHEPVVGLVQELLCRIRHSDSPRGEFNEQP